MIYRSPFKAKSRQTTSFKKQGSWKLGYHIVYRTADGKTVLYAHMRDKPTLKVGAKIKAGQKLGTMGNTGNSYGAHLHIEIQSGATWGYGKNLLNPNDFIDWDKFNSQDGDYMAKPWKNGSTNEKVYQTVADCKAKKNSIGSLSAREEAECVAIVDGCYLLTYSAGSTTKAGFVAYPGGVK